MTALKAQATLEQTSLMKNVITIDSKEDKPEDMDDKQNYLIAQLRACQQKATNIRFELDQVQAAQNVFTNETKVSAT